MKSKLSQKLLAGILSVAMLLNMGITPVFAATEEALPGGTSSVCTHHVHDEKCGYTEGAPCTHEHTDECYTEVKNCVHEHTAECYPVQDSGEATGSDAKEPTACTHICDEASGCITKELACKHEHNAECGYKEGTPCTFDPATCKICYPKDSGIVTKTITAFAPLAQSEYALPIGADEATIANVLVFPKTIKATVNKAEIDLAVTWESDKALSTEKVDTFTYTAKLTDEGYTLAEGISLPTITVAVEEVMAQVPSLLAAEEPADVSSTGVDLYNVKENTTYKAGSGTIQWEPTLDANIITSGKLTLTDATITTDNETINGAIGLPYECAIELVVNGTNAVSHTGDRSAINGTAIALTMTGSGTLTTDGYGGKGIDVGELSEGQQVPNIADTVRLNGLLVYIKESRAYLTVYGSVTFAKTWSLTADDFTVDKKATLTVPGGVIMRFMNSTNSRITFTNNGTWTNNGTVKLPNTTPAGDIPKLKLTGTGKVNISDFYNNEGVLLPHFSNTPLTFSATTADAGNLTDDGYEWKKDTQTLTLKNLWLEVSKDGSAITLPDGAKLVLQGTSTVIAKNSAICAKGNLTVSGADGILKAGGTSSTSGRSIEATGTLTVDSGTILSAGNNASMYANAIEIKAGTIDLGAHGMMTANATLTISGGNVTTGDNEASMCAKDIVISGGMVKTGASIQGSIFATNLNGGTARTSINITGGTVIANGGNHQPTPFGILAMNGTISITENAVVTATGGAAAILASDGTITDTGMTAATTPKGGKVVSATVDMPNGNDSTIQMKFTSYTADATLQAEQGMITNACTTVSLAKTQTPPDSGSGSGGGSSSGGTVTRPPTTITPTNPNPPTTGEIKAPTTVDKNGNASITVTDKTVADAIKKAQAEAEKNGTEKNGVTVTIKADTGSATNLTAALPKATVDALVKSGVKETSIQSGVASIALSLDTLKEIQKQAGGDATINASKADVSKLSKEAQNEIGDRPVFNLSITGKDGKNISDFGGGSATVSIPYTLQPGENPNNLQAFFVDAKGKLHEVTCTYDPVTKCMVFVTNHFSTYGIGYKENAPKFSDIEKHWAKNDIEFVAARGLLSGTDKATFSPDSAITRKDFAAALAKLSGKDVSKIVENSNKAEPITRQEMAEILLQFSKGTGYNFPQTRAEMKFSDAKNEAVKSMQMAGVIMGKDGNRFDPTATATRAEVSAVLRRYVELIIDKATAQGLDVNDSGKIVYYENGKLFTGTKTIDGTTYHFGNDGISMKIDAVIPDTKKYVIHKIVYGDTLWDIAMKNKCTVAEIVGLNGIKNPNNVPIGTELKIPQK